MVSEVDARPRRLRRRHGHHGLVPAIGLPSNTGMRTFDSRDSHHVSAIILGGGTGGITVAARLLRGRA